MNQGIKISPYTLFWRIFSKGYGVCMGIVKRVGRNSWIISSLQLESGNSIMFCDSTINKILDRSKEVIKE